MRIINETDILRIQASKELDPNRKGAWGQYFTPGPICQFMASLFNNIEGDIHLLDPGCGVGSLLAAFVDEALFRNKVKSVNITAYDIEPIVVPYLTETLHKCEKIAGSSKIRLKQTFIPKDFILETCSILEQTLFSQNVNTYTHVLMNPPYKKINNGSIHRIALSKLGIETVNLYTGFVALAIKLLKPNGELVAIIPRSFCNGPYYKPFRELLLNETSIAQIHIFNSRSNAFQEDEVLQENVIIHCIKTEKKNPIKITSSNNSDFHFDSFSKSYTASDMSIRIIDFKKLVYPDDEQKIIRIAQSESEEEIIDALSYFTCKLPELNINISTGPVVEFRLSEYLVKNPVKTSVPLLYPVHLSRTVHWPKESKKPNSILVTEKTKPWLWKNRGHYIITKRFSSKEENRRIVASYYDSKLPFELIGFENKLNVFHSNKEGIDQDVAKGLFVYLNSTLLDKYYRQFGGHTQVNASDLKALNYPSITSLIRIGKNVTNLDLSQAEIDKLLTKEIEHMAGKKIKNPLTSENKIKESIEILKYLGMPKAQQNERSGLTLLALLNLQPESAWTEIERPQLGVTPIMEWCKNIYKKEYAPNTRETFRRQTLHQLVDAGIVLYNPDDPSRPVNSPKACYQIVPEVFDLLQTYETDAWENKLNSFLSNTKTLSAKYAKEREMELIPLTIAGIELKLSSGAHSTLIRDIIEEFGPRFVQGGVVAYIGDTSEKMRYFNKELLSELGIVIDGHGKMPDVILYDVKMNWLFLIEAVTSHGPVDGKRHHELSTLFKDSKAGLVYVTTFPDRKTMAKYLPEISWETEVWTADAPTHMIHFNGDRFLGPHK